jgi:DNA mismatch repair protein MutL
MPRIRILPADLINKIAAGEVIERPASVVKELIENAIDAGSTDIRVDVLHGGKRLMRVSDNGAGMEREDAVLCFERHATSKLLTEDDLFRIRTMGFRGEALPSIASVSRVKLITGLKDSPLAVSVEISGGEISEVKEVASIGTTVEVRDLFFNTPVRKKFLKSTGTEIYHIIDIITKEALSHWQIAFRLVVDNKETVDIPISSGMKERIMQIYGEEFLSGLVEVSSEEQGMRLTACVSRSNNFRNTKSHQFIFLNMRPIKDQSLSHAVYSAYEGILPREKHPIFFLYLEMEPARVDVNVHPTKREVRFQDRESIYRFVYNSVKEAVRSERSEFTKPFTEMPSEDSIQRADTYSGPCYSPSVPHEIMAAENLELAYKPLLPFIYLGDTFVAVSGRGGLTLIDHHAAHERVLYEKFLRRIHLNSHQLLFPQQVRLSHKEYSVILENSEILADLGIEVEDFGHDTVIVRSLPDALREADMRGILCDLASCMIEGHSPGKSFREELAARIACHSSVRGKEILNQEELSSLLTELEQTENPDQCPHGRPTRIFFSLEDLKKIFKRK